MAERQLFGTDGIRGRAGTEPMTPELGLKLGRAIGYVARRGRSRTPRIVIGKDTRLSGYMLETAIAAGIRAVLNFSPGAIKVPHGVKLKNVDLTVSLESLSFFLARGESDAQSA